VATTTIRVTGETQAKLRALAEQRGETMQQVLAEAVEWYRRQRLIEETNARYAALRQDPAAWADEQGERAAWDGTLADGLVDD
jgi:predicted transcriptional regulator